jgi:hypothetical protein
MKKVDVNGLIGYNILETANNIVGAVRLYEMGIREMDDIIHGIHQVKFLGIPDKEFAEDLVKFLFNYEPQLETFISYFIEDFLVVGDARLSLVNAGAKLEILP